MATTTHTRNRGVIGRLVDETNPALIEAVGGRTIDGPLLYLDTPKGGAIVMTEGVGWQEHDGQLAVPMADWDEDPKVPVDIVRFAAIAGEERDLADHIRVFGSRLENNFREWYRAAKGER